MDDSKRAQYRDMIFAARGESKHPVYYEMCAAGWAPEPTDRRAQILVNHYFGIQIDLADKVSSLYKVHFDLMGERVPLVCHRIHPFDDASMRWRYASGDAPAPQSVAQRAFMETEASQRLGIEPDVEYVEAAIAQFFPNWRIIGRAYFEPKPAT